MPMPVHLHYQLSWRTPKILTPVVAAILLAAALAPVVAAILLAAVLAPVAAVRIAAGLAAAEYLPAAPILSAGH